MGGQQLKWLMALGLSVNAQHTLAEIRAAYHKQALRFHPDKNKAPDATDQFKRINEAFEGLATAYTTPRTAAQRDGEGSNCDMFNDDLPGALHTDWVAADHGLYEAVWHEDIVLAKALLEQGARPDQYRNNIWGGTALMLAAQTGNLELVMLLLVNGADLNATDLKGKTPIDWAQRRKHPEVLSVFRTFARGFAGARL